MKSKLTILLTLLITLVGIAFARDNGGVDPEALIEQILEVARTQQGQIQDLTMDAVLTEGERDRDSLIVEDKFIKKVFVKYLPDTAWFSEDYFEYYKNGELQPEKELEEIAKEKIDKKKKRKSLDISYSLLTPLETGKREYYEISYKGIADDQIEGHTCHRFRIEAREKDEARLNGDYYFEIDGFHLVRVEFTPSKRVSNLMFKMKTLDMSLTFKAYPDGLWLPHVFNIGGKGKVGFLFGVTFAGTEVYSNPVINTGLPDAMFQEVKE
jgi:hypothetical protein